MEENGLLGEALSTETPTDTPDPAQVEETPVNTEADSSLQQQPESAPPEEKAEPTRAELDFKALREQKTTLETELSGLRSKFSEYGGEAQLQIMQPFMQVAGEIPSSPAELDEWSPKALTSLKGVLMPTQYDALVTEATAEYTKSPQGQLEICSFLFNDGQPVTKDLPQAIAEFAKAYMEDPTILDALRPDETEGERNLRLAAEAEKRKDQERIEALERENEKREVDTLKFHAEQTMSQVLQSIVTSRDEIKKQYGLEFQANANDTPEIAAFKQRASARYDQLVRTALGSDSELNRLANQAEYLAGQKDPAQRKRAVDQFAPLMEQKARKVCAQVAKDLAEDLKLFGTSDSTKGATLKTLTAQVLGGGGAVGEASGFDLSDMPDFTKDPTGYANWVARKTAEVSQAERTPAMLRA